jgi:hypothetical protein
MAECVSAAGVVRLVLHVGVIVRRHSYASAAWSFRSILHHANYPSKNRAIKTPQDSPKSKECKARFTQVVNISRSYCTA